MYSKIDLLKKTKKGLINSKNIINPFKKTFSVYKSIIPHRKKKQFLKGMRLKQVAINDHLTMVTGSFNES